MNTRKIKASKDAYLLGMSLPIYFWTKGFGRLIKTMRRLSKEIIILFHCRAPNWDKKGSHFLKE